MAKAEQSIVRATDEKPSDAMPQAGFADFREQAEWWQATCNYWRAVALKRLEQIEATATHGNEALNEDWERLRRQTHADDLAVSQGPLGRLYRRFKDTPQGRVRA